MAFVEPMYNVACRQMMSKCLESQYVEVKDRVQQGVTRQGYKNYLNLITDIWTSLTNEAYLSVTASYVNTDWKMRTPVLATVLMDEQHSTDCTVFKEDNRRVEDQ